MKVSNRIKIKKRIICLVLMPLLSYKIVTNLLIDSSKQIVLLSSGNANLSLLANAYQSLLSEQNVFMLQVASINSALSNTLSAITYGSIVSQYRLEETCMANFRRITPNALDKSLDKSLDKTVYNRPEYRNTFST